MTQSLRPRSSLLRLLGGSGLVAALVLVSSLAFAGENGTLILTNGEVLSGEIVAVHQGDHVVIKLGTGEVKAVAWAQIGTLQVGAGFVIGNGQVQPQPQPQPTYQPQPQPQPTYQPQPAYQPQPTYQPQPPPAPRRRVEVWMPRFELGARLMSVTSGGDILGDSTQGTSLLKVDEVIGSGMGIQLDAGFHLLPAWSLYGFWEHDQYGRGSGNPGGAGKAGTGNVVGVGLRWNSAPHHPVGILVDAAVGGRWINFSMPTGSGVASPDEATAVGGEFRLAAGLSIGSNAHFRIEPALYFTAGGYSSFNYDNSNCPPGDTCSTIDPSQRGSYYTVGLQIGAHFDL
jgi:hypothetical protein